MKISTKSIAYISLLSAVCVLLNTFTFTMPGSSYAISLTYIPTFLAGFYFGPFAGILVGTVGDVLGCIIWPKGPWIPLITLASALMGVIPGLVRYLPFHEKVLLVISFLVTFVVCSLGVNTYALWITYAATKKTFWVYLVGRLPLQSVNMLMNLVVTLVAFPFFKRLIVPRAKNATAA